MGDSEVKTAEPVKKKLGRPKGSKTKKRRTPIVKKVPVLMHRCVYCGKEWADTGHHFYMSASSDMFNGNEKYTHICTTCVNEIYDKLVSTYGDTKLAIMCICYMLDWFFSDEIYEQQKNRPDFKPGIYARCLNTQQYKGNTFRDTLLNMLQQGGSLRSIDEVRESAERGWSAADLRNKKYVLSVTGYDCFDDPNFDTNERKFLFNTMAAYAAEDLADDPHKLSQTIVMIKAMLQISKLDKMINEQIKYQINDSAKMKELMASKALLIRNISSIAIDNGISERGSKGQKKASTLTALMGEMEKNGFEAIKVNYVDSKLSESYREIAEANARALTQELNLTSDDYAEMVAKQADMIRELQEKVEALEEENRRLYVQVKESGGKNGNS